MKKILTVILTLSLAAAVTACGKTSDKGTTVKQATATVDPDGNEIKGTTIDGAGEEVDMKKIDGETLKAEKNTDAKSDGEVAGLDVSIEDAKLMTTEEGSNILVVSFKFKNTTSEPLAFDNLLSVEATQNQSKVRSIVITNSDGINILSCVELVDPGKTTTVQKTYRITDTETPVDILVYKYGEPNGNSVKKTFNLK